MAVSLSRERYGGPVLVEWEVIGAGRGGAEDEERGAV